jgi:hypothetical protein
MHRRDATAARELQMEEDRLLAEQLQAEENRLVGAPPAPSSVPSHSGSRSAQHDSVSVLSGARSSDGRGSETSGRSVGRGGGPGSELLNHSSRGAAGAQHRRVGSGSESLLVREVADADTKWSHTMGGRAPSYDSRERHYDPERYRADASRGATAFQKNNLEASRSLHDRLSAGVWRRKRKEKKKNSSHQIETASTFSPPQKKIYFPQAAASARPRRRCIPHICAAARLDALVVVFLAT